MEAKMMRVGDVTIISMKGKLTIEETLSLRKACLNGLNNQKLIFCLNELSFVGSSGIQNLFEILGDLNRRNPAKMKVIGVNKDFKRVLEYTQAGQLEIYDQVDGALKSFEMVNQTITE